MDRISGANYLLVALKRMWQDRNLSLNQAGTFGNAVFFNGVQEEICSVVEIGAGGTMDVANNGQLLAAIQTMISAAQGQYKSVSVVTAASTLTAAQAGEFIDLFSSSATFVTTINPGTADLDYTVYAGGSFAQTLETSSGVFNGPDGNGLSSLTLPVGAVMELLTDGTNVNVKYSSTTVSTALSAETAARIAADTALSTAVGAETTARIAADAALSTAIGAEATARIAADTALSTAIGAEATRAEAAALGGSAPSVVTGSRALGTTYTNSYGRPIFVKVSVSPSGTGASIGMTVGGVTQPPGGFDAGSLTFAIADSAIVPAGATYSAQFASGSGTLTGWTET